MKRTKRKIAEIEDRIANEIVVDAYGPEEQAIGWYCYLEQQLTFPFNAKCVNERATSPLRLDEKVEVVAMAPENECEREMFVMVDWNDRRLAVPLAQLQAAKTDSGTTEAIGDWHYWINSGYKFG